MTYKEFHMIDILRDNVSSIMRNLEFLMKSLLKYIEDKREVFPRLFFLSNEQIIEMCGVVEDIASLEKNFHKMFEGIHKLIIIYKEHSISLKLR